ncbi:MAG TPA: BON domain-containing protein [Longimicrobiaceae bacterium]|nr:BON domain-containing protein [Longimicrobiaceae bacterium]
MASDRDGAGDASGRALLFALGAAGGLAAGLFLAGSADAPAGGVGGRLRGVALNLRPGRLRRARREQLQLVRLEDAVLEAFLHDEVLSERAVDVGAISPGIVEISGAVRTPDEAERAVRTARGVGGVDTVVNRMEVEDDLRRHRRDDTDSGGGTMAGEWTGRGVGMGARRQGGETEPPQDDDAQHIREAALEDADRAQFEDEDLAHSQPRLSARPGHGDPRTDNAEDELDNQDPYGKHAVPVPERPQAFNSGSRVGEGLTPGTELRLEGADLPVKPHGDPPRETEGGEG